ncbi:MAG: hypothetical protein A2X18_10215 [Bacteroidetes bacterium GWF2_40_14]|nr:MAG: hypothetical protein A2X18_10215 [Bacteroidetes bacterium GWF2_40_14]
MYANYADTYLLEHFESSSTSNFNMILLDIWETLKEFFLLALWLRIKFIASPTFQFDQGLPPWWSVFPDGGGA